jgi:hypothetical protein
MDWPLVLGAIAAGGSSIGCAVFSVNLGRKQARQECDARIDQLNHARREGVELGRREAP